MNDSDSQGEDPTIPIPGGPGGREDLGDVTQPSPALDETTIGRPSGPSRAAKGEDVDPTATRPTTAEPRIVAGRYRMQRRLAAGAFGVVYEGSYLILGQQRRVAIKLLKGRGNTDPASTVRFREEVKTLCQLDHPNICKVLDGGVEETGALFLVMDFADGGSLKGAMKTAGGFVDPETAMRWLEESARGLLVAESNKDNQGRPAPVHHRDVKPENLLLQQGRVVVADFGAAKLGGDNPGVTSELVPSLWTPAYGSPEQSMGVADHRSDIYSLGASFFHLLTGETTMARFTDQGERLRIAHDPCTVRDTVPKGLGAIVRRMTEPNASDRYQSFGDVLEDIAELRVEVRPKWPLRVLGGVVAAVLAVSGLQVAGVIDLFGVQVVIDDTELPIGKVAERVRKLQTDVATLETQGFGFIPALVTELTEVTAQVEVDLKIVTEIEEILRPEQGVRLRGDFVPLIGLEKRVSQLQLELKRHTEVHEKLCELEQRLKDGMAIKLARAKYQTARERIDPLSERDELLAFASKLKTEIDRLSDDREALVADLETTFLADEFEGLAEKANKVADAMASLEEVVLAAQASQVALNVAGAAKLRARLPDWPASTDGVLSQLDALDAQLTALVKLEPDVMAELKKWFDAQADSKRAAWAQRAADAFGQKVESWGSVIADFDGRAAAKNVSAIDRAALVNERAQLIDEQEKLRASKKNLDSLSARLISFPLAQALSADFKSPVILIESATADLTTYKQILSNEELVVDPSAQGEELREVAGRLQNAMQTLRALVLDAKKTPPKQAGWEKLSAQKEVVVAAGELYLRARDAFARYQAAEKGLADRSYADLREATGSNSSLTEFAKLEQFRAQLSERVAMLAKGRKQRVDEIVATVRSGAALSEPLFAKAASIKKQMEQCDESALAQRAATVLAVVAAGMQLEPAAWQPDADTSSVEELERFAKDLQGLIGTAPVAKVEVTAESVLLDQWWSKRQAALANDWCARVVVRWTALHIQLTEVGRNSPMEPGAERRRREKLLGSYERAFQSLLVLADHPRGRGLLSGPLRGPKPRLAMPRSVEEIPVGWPSERFNAPVGVRSRVLKVDDAECRRLYDATFLKQAEAAKLRLWYHEGRKDLGGQQIYMVFAQSPDQKQAALIDVHPITFAELRLRQYRGFFFGAYYKKSFDDRDDEVMAYNTSRALALEFAGAVAAKVPGSAAFAIPPDNFDRWPLAAPVNLVPLAKPRSEDYPIVKLPCEDVSLGGLCWLRSGVREWTETKSVGDSEIGGTPSRGERRRDTGFRLAIVLAPRTQ